MTAPRDQDAALRRATDSLGIEPHERELWDAACGTRPARHRGLPRWPERPETPRQTIGGFIAVLVAFAAALFALYALVWWSGVVLHD